MGYRFEELEVRNKSLEYITDIYDISSLLPAPERFGLQSQLRKASSSVALNIAEGSGRYHTRELVRFIRIARGSLYETVAILEIVKRLGYLSVEHYQNLYERSHEISRMLNGLCRSLEKMTTDNQD